ncbi:archaemetzincin family Zn-dependent metalloprotease [Methanoculleus sp. Wushi-C6]|uniref:Archaemetzincin n=1 Tax=Methanoculleus caldifontis TaxID=2651577 RepID=A0ABU3WYB3_9EURY|nr:archaemetzincin family Zn-dependent metalloprotease [Methanoculleus sp. Wushi-C6]MDV2480789.1 archaemetzincin family Zn-dependent metalloprotease [Methanoculleus sp. Wushi-C6]
MSIVLVPVGKVDPAELRPLREFLGGIFSADVKVAGRVPLPAAALNPGRGQYDAEVVLESLPSSGEAAGADRALEVAGVDLYLPGMNFVFGIADRKKALISLLRLRQSFYGLPEDAEVFRRRTVVEAVHELGHTFGLAHCEDSRCVMHFSNTIADTDRKGPGFCPSCRSRLAAGETRPGQRQGRKD